MSTTKPAGIWGLSTYFNPAGYQTKRDNFGRFAQGLRRQGLKLLVVELVAGDSDGELAAEDVDALLQVRSDTVLWHKERLLNLGLAALPDSCASVVWLDADVLFEADDWVAKTCLALEEHPVVQPFSRACWLPRGATSAAGLAFPPGLGTGHFMPGMGKAMSRKADHAEALKSYFTHGHTGFAWAARRSLLDRHGFFDHLVLGGGDTAMARAMYSPEPYEDVPLSPALAASLDVWRRAFHRDVAGRVGFVKGRLLHLWHGELTDRAYTERAQVLVDGDFDPTMDLSLDAQGCWAWASDKPALHAAVAAYFGARREDG